MAIRKVVVACAGKGTRMLHLTKNKPKPLIRVHKKPFLAYLLDNLLKAGYKELILVVGYKAEIVEDFIKKYGYRVEIVNQFKILGEKKYGTACVAECVKNVVGKENFLLIYSDNLFSPRDLKSFNTDDNYNYIATRTVENPKKYGVLLTDKNGFLEKIVEKPKKFVGNLVNAGIYKFTPEIFEKISQIKKSTRGEYELTDAVSLLAKEKKVKVKKIQDPWVDFSNPSDIIKCAKFLKNGNNQSQKNNGKTA